ncbi:MAG: type IV secretion system DNA-binding domain-containing protein [Victivallales bacterium]|jgi:hypothetical protein
MHSFYNGLGTQLKVAVAVLQLLIIYHFYVFYILQPSRKKLIFWQMVLYVALAAAGYSYLLRSRPDIYASYFRTNYAATLYRWILAPGLDAAFYLPLLTSAVLVFQTNFLHRLFPEKHLKHGPSFVPTKSPEEGGIYVGDFDQGVLPPHVRGFSRRFTDKLIIPHNRLSRGITILGDMGSGKSRLMQILEESTRQQYPDIPILIHDPKGEWLRTFYNPETDLIFAPYDRRSCSWDVVRDFRENPEMLHSVVSTAIEAHHSGSQDRFWSDKAVDLIKEAFSYPDIDKARKYLKHKRDTNSEDRTFLSVYSTATIGFKDIAAVQLMNAGLAAPARTITDFISHKGRIFLLNSPACKAEQAGALTLFLSAFLLKTISMPDMGEGRLRAVAMIDEALTFHLPTDVEVPIYSQSRSKGLCIIASAQWLPKKADNERGLWANMANHIFAMRITDLETRSSFSQRIGNLLYDEKQKSVSTGDKSSSSTTSEVEKQHHAFAPEDYGRLKNREFLLFHETGVAPGRVRDIDSSQNDTVKTIDYTPRTDLVEYMKDL